MSFPFVRPLSPPNIKLTTTVSVRMSVNVRLLFGRGHGLHIRGVFSKPMPLEIIPYLRQ